MSSREDADLPATVEGKPASPCRRAADLFARTDGSDAAVAAARAARSLVPNTRASGRVSDRVAAMISETRPEKASAMRELGLAAVGVWQNLITRRPATPASDEPVAATILFTDLVGFSTWALGAGDDRVLDLLGEVNSRTDSVVRRRGGRIVKHLGDGTMAVFLDGSEAIEAAHEVIVAVSALTVDGYRPQLRAGLHTGAPRVVDDDYLGVDVNIAARVADAAGAGELLVTAATLAQAAGTGDTPADTASSDARPRRYVTRRRRFKAKGVPRDIEVFAVIPRYED